VAIGALLAMTFGILLLSKSAQAGPVKLEVCHIPPGNPDNFHTITVNEKALPAHFEHQDLNGACDGFCADLCDDGDVCTFEDSENCELGGCPVPQPVDCGPGQICDAQQGCIPDPDLESECPCFTAEDLSSEGSYFLCANPFDGFPGLAGVLFDSGGVACSGPGCASEAGLSCGLSPEFTSVNPITAPQNTACQTLINDYCGLGPLPVAAERSSALGSTQQSFMDKFK
jgi:hypothetical protein